jgi:hypothetical protein
MTYALMQLDVILSVPFDNSAHSHLSTLWVMLQNLVSSSLISQAKDVGDRNMCAMPQLQNHVG